MSRAGWSCRIGAAAEVGGMGQGRRMLWLDRKDGAIKTGTFVLLLGTAQGRSHESWEWRYLHGWAGRPISVPSHPPGSPGLKGTD